MPAWWTKLKSRLQFAKLAFDQYDNCKCLVMGSVWDLPEGVMPSTYEHTLSVITVDYFDKRCVRKQRSPKVFGESPI